MPNNIDASLFITGDIGTSSLVVRNNNLDAFAIDSNNYVYMYKIDIATPAPTYSFLIINPDNNRIEYTHVLGATGQSGTSGTSGTSGSSGTSGVNGTSGTSGTSGADGEKGDKGDKYIVDFISSDSITFVTASVIQPYGISFSAFVKQNSLTPSYFDTGNNGNATESYILSNTSDGKFSWVKPLSVVDYNLGITYSSINNIILRGNVVTVPSGTSSGVEVVGDDSSVTVWIPTPTYVKSFSPIFYDAPYKRYISTPTIDGYYGTFSNRGYYGVGTSWSTTQSFINNETRDVINLSDTITAFFDTEFSCYDKNTTISFYLINYNDYPMDSIVGYTISSIGSTSSDSLTVNITSFEEDSDRYKASINGTINVGYKFPNGGKFHWKVVHNDNGHGTYSFIKDPPIFYDNDGTQSSASVSNIFFDELAPNYIYYSGVAFYGLSSSFTFNATNINLLNDITIPTTKQLDISFDNLDALTGSYPAYGDGSKPEIGSAINGWTLGWSQSNLTYSNIIITNVIDKYIPGFTNSNNLIDLTPKSNIGLYFYDYSQYGPIYSENKLMLFDTKNINLPTYNFNSLDSELGRLSSTYPYSTFTSSMSLINNDELQYIFGRIIYPQSNFITQYPLNTAIYSGLTGSNKSFDIYTMPFSIYPSISNITFSDYRWFTTTFGKTASYSQSFTSGKFEFISNFTESDLEFNGKTGMTGSNDLILIVGIDSNGTNLIPDKFLYISGNPSIYEARQLPISYNLDDNQSILWNEGMLGISIKKIWLFVGYKNSLRGKELYLSSINFS